MPARTTTLLYFLFFCSGISGLIYQVVWVRVFGNVFGNTIYSASLVIAVFMLGLGVGSYVVGAWADRRYAALNLSAVDSAARRRSHSEPLLRAYGVFELAIGLLGLGIAALLPHLDRVSALTSAYVIDGNGWYVLSTASYLARVAVALMLLTPVTLLMGGTLTLLIRHLVRHDVDIGGWRIAALYGVNTIGAAFGCLLTDFTLVPAVGLLATQTIAAGFNAVAAAGALYLAASAARVRLKPDATTVKRGVRLQPDPMNPGARAALLAPAAVPAVTFTAAALALSGFAAMGMEILWFRHFSILLGEFRAVFSLLLTIVLFGLGLGSLAGGLLQSRTGHPAQWLILGQGLFAAFVLLGFGLADADRIRSDGLAHAVALAASGVAASGWARALDELWFNGRPMLLEVAVPALLMGFAFPLGNAIIQRAERFVGRRAGALYLANTTGAVCGALASGFLLLPALGLQGSASVLTVAAGLAIVPLHLAARTLPEAARTAGWRGLRLRTATAGAVVLASVALGTWLSLPGDQLIAQALVLPTDRVLALSEGVTEVITVADVPDRGRLLLTNGHPMSSTSLLSQRYMRALAHIPLLSIDNPQTVLVICFGIGNTAHAATLHPSVWRVEVVDTSRHVLTHAGYFRDANQDVLRDPRVTVYVNDGRHHLQLQREASYDLITLEPPPIAHAGVSALYSREFYALARTRLKPAGYITQWLPVSQVPEATGLAMIRAFIEVFPQAVLLSGSYADLLLVGAKDATIELDPDRVAVALAKAPAVRADLDRVALGTVRDIAASFVGAASTLAEATRNVAPTTDDRPLQEYSVRSLLKFGQAPLEAFVDLSRIAAWCPTCLVDGKPTPVVQGLDTHLALLGLAYRTPPAALETAGAPADARPRVIAGSAYLGAVVPDSPELRTLLATLEGPDAEPRYTQATALLEAGRFREAIDELRLVLQLVPDAVEARNNLGVALASLGRLDEAIDQFQQALAIRPGFADAQRNLTLALEKRRRGTAGTAPN